MVDIQIEALQRVNDVVVQTAGGLDELCTVFLQRRNNEVYLGGKVMMNAGFADTNHFGNIRITEAEDTSSEVGFSLLMIAAEKHVSQD